MPKTVIAAAAGLGLVVARHYGWLELTEREAETAIEALAFLVAILLRIGVRKAEKAAEAVRKA